MNRKAASVVITSLPVKHLSCDVPGCAASMELPAA